MISKILDMLYPRRCVLCLSPCAGSDEQLPARPIDLCAGCQADLPVLRTACKQCAIPLPEGTENTLCGQCQKKTPRFDAAHCAFHYAEPLEWLIQRMKFHRKPAITNLLAEIMATHISDQIKTRPDVIIPVPLHYKRQQERGYNQAEELARVIGKKLNIPVDSKLIERHLPSQKQSGLDAKERRRNVKNIFRLRNNNVHDYRHVALLDDVMSTGSTLNEISRLLKRNGISRIDIWLLARASLD